MIASQNRKKGAFPTEGKMDSINWEGLMRDESAIIESLHYLLKKLQHADKLKLVKLLFFADKYHLLKYARQISGDNYHALPAGPIPSGALDILNFVSEYGISA